MFEIMSIIGILTLCLTNDNKSNDKYKDNKCKEIKKEDSCLRYKVRYTNSSGCVHVKVMSEYEIEMQKVIDTNFKIIDKLPYWAVA
jgi:peptidyl-tRNA hydrolase